MSHQLSLDWMAEARDRTVTHAPRARRDDVATSHDAAARAATFAADHETRILKAIKDAGERGATAKEIAPATGLTDVQVNRRLGAIGERGVIERRLTDPAVRVVPMALRSAVKSATMGTGRSTEYRRRGGCCIWWAK